METKTQLTVEEGNRLIFDFMGCKHSQDTTIDVWEMSGLKYHYSWDWLMPVVRKIWNISEEFDGNYIEKNEFYEGFYGLTIHSLYITATIEVVWQAVTEFIQWYNTQSK